jgi:hypothetical protein
MVEINGRLASGLVIDSYQKIINNDNTRTQAKIMSDNLRLNRTQDRGFVPAADENTALMDVTIPRKSEINFKSKLQELNTTSLKNQDKLNERRNLDELRNSELQEKGIGLNINILI